MRGDRTTRTDMPYDAQGFDQGFGADGGYNGGQPAGFKRHTSSNARRVAAQNPLKDGARKLGGAVAGLGRSAVSKIPRPTPKAPQASVSYNDGDFLGSGIPCRVCGNPVDQAQVRCPHCGAYVKPLYKSLPFWVLVAVAGSCGAVVACDQLLSLRRAGEPRAGCKPRQRGAGGGSRLCAQHRPCRQGGAPGGSFERAGELGRPGYDAYLHGL